MHSDGNYWARSLDWYTTFQPQFHKMSQVRLVEYGPVISIYLITRRTPNTQELCNRRRREASSNLPSTDAGHSGTSA